MASLTELAHRHTELGDEDVARLHRLVADWGLLADLAFSDLVLWLPTWSGSGYVAAAQVRPSTGPTVFADDLVGSFLPRGRRPLLDEALASGRLAASRVQHALVPLEAVPVLGAGDTGQGQPIAVLARHADPAAARPRGRLEEAYVEIADRLTRMVAEGTFPVPSGDDDLDAAPRVGDGLLRLDGAGEVVFASPNALSAYRRLGLAADLVGSRLDVTTRHLAARRGPVDEDLAAVAGGRQSGTAELDVKGVTLQLRSIPLLESAAGGRSQRVGAVVLVRDVTDLRRRERELLTKDATIREIHHRVKNNLQTVAALLRLQGRRLAVGPGREALAEAERRVAAIALVHELLSTSPDERVPFDEVADRLLTAATELAADLSAAPPAVHARREGSFGDLPAETATPLAVVLGELVQNAVEHGLAECGGEVLVRALPEPGGLQVEVIDDGSGLPSGFDPATGARLGLQIVRTLVEGELGGRLQVGDREEGESGTRAVVSLPAA